MVDRPPESLVAGGFAAASPTAVRMRPVHARAAIGHIKQAVDPRSSVLVPAAGTGVLAGQLWRAGMRLVAAEVDADRLGQLRRSLPSMPVVRAVPGAVPFVGGRFAAVVVAQFDASTVGEASRLLEPGGALVLVRVLPAGSPDGALDGFGDPVVHRFTEATTTEVTLWRRSA